MKRFSAITAILASAMSLASAQYNNGIISDALVWNTNDYYGSARTIGMGNAFTAVGGDIGSLAINPAASSVAGYSSVSFSPGTSTNFTTASFGTKIESGTKNERTRFIVPGGGVIFNINLDPSSTLRRVAIGLSANTTEVYNDKWTATGIAASSYTGCLAAHAYGTPESDIGDYYLGKDVTSVMAYKAGGIFKEPGILPEKEYIGITENYDESTGLRSQNSLRQDYTREVRGTKTDYIINLGFDIADYVHVGANLGIQNIQYRMSDIMIQAALPNARPSDFDYRFKSMDYGYEYVCRGTGVYGKFGIIATPVAGLRIGAAIQTPTRLFFSESCQETMRCTWYTDDSGDVTRSGNTAVTPSSENWPWRYRITAPFRFNLGLAYNFGERALVSVDYERVNYGQMRFEETVLEDRAYFEDVNRQIQGVYPDDGVLSLKESNILRAGLEVSPIEVLKIRCGYNLATDAQVNAKRSINARISSQSFSFGLGYDSPGSFFCDIAARYSLQPDRFVNGIYADYVINAVEKKDGSGETIRAPVVSVGKNLLTVTATIGWRF